MIRMISQHVFILPIISLHTTIYVFYIYFAIVAFLAMYGSYKERKPELMLALPGYILLRFVNAYIFLEQFFKEVVLKKRNLFWFKPQRTEIN